MVQSTPLWQRAEAEAASYLEQLGFSIVARNLRLGHLELDIVARREELVVVVEVRSRSSAAWTRPIGSVNWQKRQRVRRAGERLWQRRYRHDSSAERMRFDIISVIFLKESVRIEHVVAAF